MTADNTTFDELLLAMSITECESPAVEVLAKRLFQVLRASLESVKSFTILWQLIRRIGVRRVGWHSGKHCY